MTLRQHRNQTAYPAMWRAIDGAIRAAMAEHKENKIPNRFRQSIIKRIVGHVLALQGVGSVQAYIDGYRPEDWASC